MRYDFLILSLLSHAAFAADLSLAKFTYEGEYKIGGVGQSSQGIAYRPASDTWFTVAGNGNAPFVVKEFRLTTAGSVLVREWGALNSDGKLAVSGNLVGCRGLLYDDQRDGIWFSFGSWYAMGANNNFLGFVKLDYVSKSWRIEGPWGVDASVHSDTVKGKLAYTPDDLKHTGFGLVCFGEKGSTSQLQSWGPGAVLVGGYSSGLPLGPGPLAARRVVHWPMIQFATDDGVYGRSDFPCEKSLTLITGPVSSPTYQEVSYFSQADQFNTICVIDDALVYTAIYGEGYSWYGAATKYDTLNLESKLYPGQRMKSANTARGIHVEGYRPKIILVDIDDVKEAYSTGDLKVLPYETGNVQTLGGVVPMKTTTFTGTHFNKQIRKFYAVEVGAVNNVPIVRQFGVTP